MLPLLRLKPFLPTAPYARHTVILSQRFLRTNDLNLNQLHELFSFFLIAGR